MDAVGAVEFEQLSKPIASHVQSADASPPNSGAGEPIGERPLRLDFQAVLQESGRRPQSEEDGQVEGLKQRGRLMPSIRGVPEQPRRSQSVAPALLDVVAKDGQVEIDEPGKGGSVASVRKRLDETRLSLIRRAQIPGGKAVQQQGSSPLDSADHRQQLCDAFADGGEIADSIPRLSRG